MTEGKRGRMRVELTKSQCENLVDFIDSEFIDSIRNDEEMDNIEYIRDMIMAREALKEAAEEAKP